MPGLGMCLCLRQELKLEQKLECKLSLRLVQQLKLLESEEEFEEQREILNKILGDISYGVYSDTENLHHRVMKRIKKEDRSDNVKELIGSIRALIDRHKEAGKDISLDGLREVLGLGLGELDKRRFANKVFDSLAELSPKLNDSLEKIVEAGRDFDKTGFGPSRVFGSVAGIGEKTYNEISAQQCYDKIRELMHVNERNAKVALWLFDHVMERDRKYKGFRMNALFDLIEQTCSLVVPEDHAYSKMKPDVFIGKRDLDEMIECYSNIPLPILSELSVMNLGSHGMDLMNEIAGTKHMRKSKDNKRQFFNSIVKMMQYKVPARVITDMLEKADGVKQARDIFVKFAALLDMPNAEYNPRLENGEEILKSFRRLNRQGNPLFAELSDDAIERFEEIVCRKLDNPYIFAYKPLINISSIYLKEFPEGFRLAGRLMESLIFDRFRDLKYCSDEADKQLSCLHGCVEVWMENKDVPRLLGDTSGLEPKYKAIRKIRSEMKQRFIELYEEDPVYIDIGELNRQRGMLISHIAQKKVKGDDLGEDHKQVDRLTGMYSAAIIIQALHKIDKPEQLPTASIPHIGAQLHEDFQTALDNVLELIKSPEVKNSTPLLIRDTDDPNAMIDVGCTPVRTCQRWTEHTSYNKCLLAYVADANKRLIQVIDGLGSVKARSIYRLLPVELEPEEDTKFEGPMLFVETLYTNLASENLYKAILGEVIDKAYRMSEQTGEPVAVGVSCESYCNALEALAERAEIECYEDNIKLNLPESMNAFEYTDGLRSEHGHAGCVKSGSEVKGSVKYIVINHENNSD